MKKDKYTAIMIIVVLMLLNGLLIFQNIQKTRELEILNDRIQANEYSVGYTIMDQYKNIPFVKTIITEVGLSVFISDKGCRSCIKNYIDNVNILKKKYSQYVEVYYLGLDKEYLKELGAEFSYLHLPEVNMYGILKTNQPISVLSDKAKNVIISNIALLDDKMHSDMYFKSVERLLAYIEKAK